MSQLSVYYAPAHDRPGDWDYMRRLNPPAIRILMPGATPTDLVSRVHQTAPNARIALRWWDIDDGGEAHKRAKLNHPDDAAIADAREIRQRIERMEADAHARSLPFPARRMFWANALNEPPTWEHDKRPAIVAYNVQLINELRPHGIAVLALCLAVGHPEEWPPAWDWAKPVAAAILASPGSALELHSYWQLQGPNYVWTDAQGNERKDWGALAGRYMHCPFDVPIVIGECGADGRLYNQKPQHTGWFGNMSAQAYADQIGWYLTQTQQDKRIVAVMPFLTDYQAREWATFDTHDAHEEILRMVQGLPPGPAPTPPLPDPLATGRVTAPAGLNVRIGPGVNYQIVRAIPHGTEVNIYSSAENGDGALWHQIGHDEWVHGRWVEIQSTEPVPAPPGDKWQRSIDFVLRWEGGYQNLPHDDGNWTGCKEGQGENKGTNMGISACSYPDLDIRNLTQQQAKEIYHRDYWQKSGATNLEWPLCLLVFDTAVLHGVGVATSWLKEVGPNPYEFASKRLYVYVKSDKWDFWGNAWTRRVADLLAEMG